MSTFLSTARPGMTLGEHPQRLDVQALTGFDLRAKSLLGSLTNRLNKRITSFDLFGEVLNEIDIEYARLQQLTASQLLAAKNDTACQTRLLGLQHQLVVQCFAHLKIASRELFSLELHPEQLFAAWSMLHGCITEMQTGEGKTLTAALAASTMALTGTPVHVITVNDYLAERDAEQQGSLYRYFDLRCRCVNGAMNDDDKRHAYKADVVYGTNKQIVFDYLRDSITLDYQRSNLISRYSSLMALNTAVPIMRGLGYAVVDEADSVLIDDARVPLILAQSCERDAAQETQAAVALSIASTLKEHTDYRLHTEIRTVSLTDKGAATIEGVTKPLGKPWNIDRVRYELIRQALCVLHLFEKDRHYLIIDDKIELIDESTGRIMPDRKLQHGLHRMLELKEKCTVTTATDAIAGLSFQRFFQLYCHLSGMSGTLKEVNSELNQVYGLKMISVPAHKACKRKTLDSRVFTDRESQLAYALADINKRHATGQPLLLATRSVAFSESLSDLLTGHNIKHKLLNARQDAAEAETIAEAGQTGAITVATNMAGRGTDITLQYSAKKIGGLHVINFEVNDSTRVDRQLYGRAARQGDPGSCQALLTMQDNLLERELPEWAIRYTLNAMNKWPDKSQFVARTVIRLTQMKIEHKDAQQRLTAFYKWPCQKRKLGFSGDTE
ncbi:MAG: DEAD/DEAH box helicase [Granulosicoccaceae bacterium]